MPRQKLVIQTAAFSAGHTMTIRNSKEPLTARAEVLQTGRTSEQGEERVVIEMQMQSSSNLVNLTICDRKQDQTTTRAYSCQTRLNALTLKKDACNHVQHKARKPLSTRLTQKPSPCFPSCEVIFSDPNRKCVIDGRRPPTLDHGKQRLH